MLKLQPNPTFKCKVGIPIPGEQKRHDITLTFKHMPRAQFEAFQAADGEADVDTLMRIIAGWDGVDGDFSRENLLALTEAYPGASFAIGTAYANELHGRRLGN
jgi:hypothetical protein